VVVTLGPALRAVRLPASDEVRVAVAASHDALVPRCALVVSHAGHGTVVRPLRHGVPVLCLPTGRDQPENAARVEHAGAGLRLSRRASAGAIRKAARRLLAEPAFAQAAGRLGLRIAADADGGVAAAQALERVVRDAAPAALTSART
jgi:UDP:flavonoid glycosyltransferase YjiC (YdhE family)